MLIKDLLLTSNKVHGDWGYIWMYHCWTGYERKSKCVYKTPASDIDTFCENIEQCFTDNTPSKPISVCGDFNTDL